MASVSTRSLHAEQLEDWVRQYGNSLRAYVLAMVRNSHAADDLSQEVFCKAWQSCERYQEQGQARAYLFRIADHVVCDSLRRKQPASLGDEIWQIEDTAHPASPTDSAIVAESNARLYPALDRLSPMQRRVLLLRYFGQCTFKEIAESVDCPLNTVLSHCHRALETLKLQFATDAR